MSRAGYQNLKKVYPGFKILRGYIYTRPKNGHRCVMLFIIKTKQQRAGILTKFCQDRLAEDMSIVIDQPTNQAMINFLIKNNFIEMLPYRWILTPLTNDGGNKK